MDGTINTLRRIASLGTLVGTEVLGRRGADYREEEEEKTAGGRLTLSRLDTDTEPDEMEVEKSLQSTHFAQLPPLACWTAEHRMNTRLRQRENVTIANVVGYCYNRSSSL